MQENKLDMNADKGIAREALQKIAEGISTATGKAFFQTLVRFIATSLNVQYAFIAEQQSLNDRQLKSIAFFAESDFLPNTAILLENSPCENIVGQRCRSYPHSVRSRFPEDPLLEKFNVDSFIGVPLFSSDEQSLGVLAIMNTGQIDESEIAESILQIFATRVAAELERQQAENQMRRSRANVVALIENTSDSIVSFDWEYRVTSFNNTFKELMKSVVDIDVYEGIELIRYLPPELKEFFVGLKPRFESGEHFLKTLQYGKPGENRYFELSFNPIIHDQEVNGFSAFVRDITARKKTEAALRDSEEKYRSLFEESLHAVFMNKTDGQFLDINPAGVDLLGYDSREAVFNDARLENLFVDPDDYQAIRQAVEDQGHIKDYELLLKQSDDSRIIARMTVMAVYDEAGRIIAYRCIVEDVTERRTLQQQLFRAQKLEAIGTLAGGIAHDFNNILAIILAYSELISDESEPESDIPLYIEHIGKAAGRAKDLIKQILTFSHKMEDAQEPVYVDLILDETLRLLRASIPSSIEIRTDLDRKAGTVMGNSTQIQQVIMNLCTNAYQAMGRHGGILEVRVGREQVGPELRTRSADLTAGTYLCLEVRDNGVGMDKSLVERIFDPFFTTKPVGEGTGMGLSVVHGIVKSHKGAILVDSRPGKGTLFKVYFPSYEGELLPRQTGADNSAGGSERIMLVDDETHLVQVQKELLVRLGYDVLVYDSGENALEDFRANPQMVDLVITDQAMPRITGLALARALKNIRPDLPILFLAGFSDLETVREAREIGVSDFLLKPVRVEDLGQSIRSALDIRRKLLPDPSSVA